MPAIKIKARWREGLEVEDGSFSDHYIAASHYYPLLLNLCPIGRGQCQVIVVCEGLGVRVRDHMSYRMGERFPIVSAQ